MKVLLSWIRDFVDVPGTPEEIGTRMSMRGLALEGVEPITGGSWPPWSTHTGDDAILDFDVTANRPDCLSIRGIAREIATVYALPLKAVPVVIANGESVGFGNEIETIGTRKNSLSTDALAVTIDDPDLCARYAAAIADVTIGSSPDWMQSRLTASGVRPISNVVDVTNYVLLEMGHPLHAFDLARLRGPAIVVRRARTGEKVTTLDGKERALAPDMLVIADAEHASAIGGVMGGAESEVSNRTARIVLESAWFKPQSVRATAKRLALRTEASYRFERGADLTAPVDAIERALTLLASIGAGRVNGPIIDVYPQPYQPREIPLNSSAIRRLLGMEVPDTEAVRILRSLGFEVQTLGSWHAAQPDSPVAVGDIGSSWRVTVPGWRVDVHRPVDLIEEVGRHHGYEHLPTTFPAVEQAPPPSDPRIARDQRVRQVLLAMGFSEAITFAFIEATAAEPYRAENGVVALANPLSEKFAVLRPSLIPGLVDAVSHNRRHGRRDVRLFEIGTRFARRGESRAAAIAWTGLATPEHWSGNQRYVDFFDVKGVAEQVGAVFATAVTVEAAERPYLVAGRTAVVRISGHEIGVIGQLEPTIAEARDLAPGDAVYVGEFNLDAISSPAQSIVGGFISSGSTLYPPTVFAQPLPRHPSVVRDVSLLLDEALSAETVRGTIRTIAPVILVEIREFDRYQGKGIPDGKVSLSLRLTFQASDRTLTDGEVQTAMEAIVAALTKELGAIQR